MSLSDVTCLIPLYRSKRLLPVVFDNIDSHIAEGAQVICSDEHGLDEAADLIEARYADCAGVRVLRTTEDGNWVSNCNRLITACRTPFFRIMPHDDSVPGSSTRILTEVLRARPEVVVSHGWVRAETEAGTRLPDRDEPRFPLRPVDDADAFSAAFFWQGLYSGAFKAVIRRNVARGRALLIRQTRSLKHSERAWLFGYTLLGDFAFSEDAYMVKRYWEGSVASGWTEKAEDMLATAEVMASYVDDFVPCGKRRAALRHNLYLNALRRANWLDDLLPERPEFELPWTDGMAGGSG